MNLHIWICSFICWFLIIKDCMMRKHFANKGLQQVQDVFVFFFFPIPACPCLLEQKENICILISWILFVFTMQRAKTKTSKEIALKLLFIDGSQLSPPSTGDILQVILDSCLAFLSRTTVSSLTLEKQNLRRTGRHQLW